MKNKQNSISIDLLITKNKRIKNNELLISLLIAIKSYLSCDEENTIGLCQEIIRINPYPFINEIVNHIINLVEDK